MLRVRQEIDAWHLIARFMNCWPISTHLKRYDSRAKTIDRQTSSIFVVTRNSVKKPLHRLIFLTRLSRVHLGQHHPIEQRRRRHLTNPHLPSSPVYSIPPMIGITAAGAESGWIAGHDSSEPDCSSSRHYCALLRPGATAECHITSQFLGPTSL